MRDNRTVSCDPSDIRADGMMVLDAQVLGWGIAHAMARWYRGKVQCITDVRLHTAMKDEAIPALLRQQFHPTCVTINDRDYWQRVPGDPR